MNYFPLFANLRNKPVLVVGAGNIACRKIELLRKTGAHINVVAKAACEQALQWHDEGVISLRLGEFQTSDLDGQWLVVAATENSAVNCAVEQAAVERQLLVNVVDDRELSHFVVPSVIDRHPVQVAISTGGEAPVLARSLRAQLEAQLPSSLGRLATLMGHWRDAVKQKLKRPGQRRQFWEQVLASAVPQLVYQEQDQRAEASMLRLLNSDDSPERDNNGPERGHVSLVGAGPGDPELLTIKALQRIQTADVVYYDNLVSDDVLELIRRDADRVYVGKKAGAHSCSQSHIQEQLRDAALAGKRVVRLKGGDPFVFGRGGEELEVLAEAGVSFDVVPGITAAAATAAYTGIPLTHRDYSHSAILVTGHGKSAQGEDSSDVDWQALARSKQTLAIYMGLKKSPVIAEQLIAHGRSPQTPLVIVERATTDKQRQISGVLKDLPQLVESHGVESPAMILIGEVCQLAGRYAWFGDQPVDEQLIDESQPVKQQASGF
ncbi:siroheme synthase CysG [Porticoccus sp. W117]|uniref:siroheme synthase CysG n=1 Tax=Porticoccus sp. W117 TaxID=3054777 RepID=UPI00259A4FE6|nr:siroheme synthase CysG [Porticoccus sp. W117]MDM3871575.1 siroheme synthase CysG [Porticoccus sp. W117]